MNGKIKKRLIGRKFTSSIFWCFLVIFMAYNSSSSIIQNSKGEIAKIENTVAQLYTAMVEKDKDILEDLTMEKLTYGHSSGCIENKPEYVDGVLNGAFQFSAINPVNQTVSASGDVGVVRHIFEADGTNNDKPAKVRIGCLLIFQKEGQWKLLARQAFKL
ncbi:nuclear transport factor 2 family protein [Maribacter sp. CXY002]|uniref:nuclear transport factor 2 family protein n=1 Tax=Maribacter luteocoastalis TaxID=3407671 RepID=UPI003B675993